MPNFCLTLQDLSDVGYSHLLNEPRMKQTRKSNVEVARESRRKRVVGSLPPVFPNGWFAILDSSDLAAKQVKHVTVLGKVRVNLGLSNRYRTQFSK